MSEQYTPDEAEVRDGYVTGMIRDGEGSDWDEYREGATADFDRFIAQVRAEAWDEGQRAGLGDGITAAELAIGRRLDLLPGPTPNPYRQETQR